MKKSEIVLVWIGGLWAVLWLREIAVAPQGRFSGPMAFIFAGWLICGLVWISLREWGKTASKKSQLTPPPPPEPIIILENPRRRCARCLHHQSDHVDIQRREIGRCGLCACLHFERR
jgi:hypothetical protein